MTFAPPPRFAAFQHRGAAAGFEVVWFRSEGGAVVAEGYTSLVEDGEPFAVAYEIELDERWRTRRALVAGRSNGGPHQVAIESDGDGSWEIDGDPAPQLAGCLDLDVEASSLTNAFPVRRLGLDVGTRVDAPAAYVRSGGLIIERLEQQYERIADSDGGRQRFDYLSPADGFACVLEYDESGIVLDYPGIAVRVG